MNAKCPALPGIFSIFSTWRSTKLVIQSRKMKEVVSLRKHNSPIGVPQIVAGVIAILLAVGLTCGTLWVLRQWTERAPVSTQGTTTRPVPTAPKPTLIPSPYGPGDFTMMDDYMICLAGESWQGVDVSEHQGVIDWQAVATTPVTFAVVRMAFRGWGSEGTLRADARAYENLNGAREAGLKVGVYVFSQAITVEEAVEEAKFVLAMLDGRSLDLPVVFDWETVSSAEARTANMDAETLNACAQAFCRTIEEAGYEAMVYFNLDLARRMLELTQLQAAGVDFWLAMYSQSFHYAHQIRMWQYTSTGKVAGIQGNVDLNLYFPDT